MLALADVTQFSQAHDGRREFSAWRCPALLLLAAALQALNLLVLGPRTTWLMIEMYNPDEKGTPLLGNAAAPPENLKKSFGRVHALSMIINLLALICVALYIAVRP